MEHLGYPKQPGFVFSLLNVYMKDSHLVFSQPTHNIHLFSVVILGARVTKSWRFEISNGRTHWMDPEKTWVSDSSIVTYLGLGVRWDSVPSNFWWIVSSFCYSSMCTMHRCGDVHAYIIYIYQYILILLCTRKKSSPIWRASLILLTKRCL